MFVKYHVYNSNADATLLIVWYYQVDNLGADVVQMSAVFIETSENLSDMQRIIKRTPAREAAMKEDMDEMRAMLRTLVQGNFNLPTLAVVFRDVQTGFKSFNPRNVISGQYRLVFMCRFGQY